jgi:hypothetical protein
VQPQQGLTPDTHSPFDSGSTGAEEILDDGKFSLVGDVINRLLKRTIAIEMADSLFPKVAQQLVEYQGPIGVGHLLVVLSANVTRHRIRIFGLNDSSSATGPTGRHDGNRSLMAGFAAAHGQAACPRLFLSMSVQ